MVPGAILYSLASKYSTYLPFSLAALMTPWLAPPAMVRMTSTPASIMLLARSAALLASYQLPITR